MSELESVRVAMVMDLNRSVLTALNMVGANGSERVSVAQSVFLSVLMSVIEQHPAVFPEIQARLGQFAEDTLGPMRSAESVEALLAWAQAQTEKTMFEVSPAPVLG